MNANINTGKPQEDIIDIQISGIGKKRIRVNGDDNKILLINTNDNNIVVRYGEELPNLESLSEDFKSMGQIMESGEVNPEKLKEYSKKAREIDEKMRHSLDTIFNTNVSEVCDDGGSMYDPLDNGEMRWNWILTVLMNLCSKTIQKNYDKFEAKSKQYTDKYTKK